MFHHVKIHRSVLRLLKISQDCLEFETNLGVVSLVLNSILLYVYLRLQCSVVAGVPWRLPQLGLNDDTEKELCHSAICG